MITDQEWLPVFEEIASQPYFRPRFTLAILLALDASIDAKQRNVRVDQSDDCDAIVDVPLYGLSASTMILVRWEKTAERVAIDARQHFDACRRAKCKGLLVIMPLCGRS
jgi:hypothetical protein